MPLTLPARALPALLAATALSACATTGSRTAAPVTVGVIAINDFHGALEPPKSAIVAPDGAGASVQVPAGGAAYLATVVDTVRARYANSVTVGAGDLISASQFASAVHLDEPAIGVMNRIGLDFAAVGNHEFDSGWQELRRKQYGGCHKWTSRTPCAVERFKGADFRYLAASTVRADGRTLFPATAIRSFGHGRSKVRVGMIGLTLRETPSLVSPDGVRGLTFADEAATINAAVPRLKRKGADAIVVLIHQGGATTGEPDPQGCNALTGDIRPILDKLNPGVDVVVSGHTHRSYICDYATSDPARTILLTSAALYGQMVTDITLTIDPATNRVTGKSAKNLIVQSEPYTSGRGPVAVSELYARYVARPDVSAYVKRYTDAARAFSERVVGKLGGPALKPGPQTYPENVAIVNLIADAQLAATRAAGAQIAFMNHFGVRAALVPSSEGALTYGQIFATQPFTNTLITQTLTGAELKALLEQGFDATGPAQALIPSAGFTYSFDLSRPVGDRVTAMAFNGVAIDPAANYRVTTNNFLAGGGDTFTVLAKQREAVIGISDVDALENWLKTDPPRPVPTEDRVTQIGK